MTVEEGGSVKTRSRPGPGPITWNAYMGPRGSRGKGIALGIAHWCSVEPEHAPLESAAHKTFSGVWVMEKADFKRNSALFSQIQRLHPLVGGPVPHVEGSTVMAWNNKELALVLKVKIQILTTCLLEL